MSSTISNSLSMIGGCPSRAGSSWRRETTERESVETTVSHETPVARSSRTARKRRSVAPPATTSSLAGSSGAKNA